MEAILKALFLLLISAHLADGLSWLAIGLANSKVDRAKPTISCRNLKGLSRKQLRFCKKNADLMDSVQGGAYSAHAECQFQFHKRRWNCTIVDPVTREIINDIILSEGTRESAFVHALSSAAVAYRITKDCAKGISEKCGCDYSKTSTIGSPSNSYQYQGCSDNVQYGIGVSREFVDAGERKGKNGSSMEESVINLHNNRAGRQVLEKALRRECKCHGMSGSCEMKTCWESLPTFREIGLQIKDKFDGASEVRVVQDRNETKPKILMKNTQFRRHTNADLIYMKPSPDFCDADPIRGILGTKGRQCTQSPNAIDDCALLCCGRGFEKKVEIVEDKCNCKFHYCCRVECDTCKKRVEKFFCL